MSDRACPRSARIWGSALEEGAVEEGAFEGVRVVELAQWVFVPVAGALLADWGADVVKIEHPVDGDGYRGLMSRGIGVSDGGVNLSMEMANRGKRSLGVDLKSPGRTIGSPAADRADRCVPHELLAVD